MPEFTLNLTDAQAARIQEATDAYNLNSPDPAMTAKEWALDKIRQAVIEILILKAEVDASEVTSDAVRGDM